MTNDKGSELVEMLVKLSRISDKVTKQLEEHKVLIRAFEGETFESIDGSTVTVGRASKGRVDGTKLEFSDEVYHSLDEDMKRLLEKLGLVKVVPKTVKAMAAKVTVKLAPTKIKA